MYYNSYFAPPKHKVFISYYHHDDQQYRDYFEWKFGHLFISKSVQLGDIATDLSTEYIKRLIQEDYLSDSSVVIVLVGPNTKCRKHVDWEISAGLNSKVHGCSGLLGILLPTFPLTAEGTYYYYQIPGRLADNVASTFASVWTWDWLCASGQRITDAIEQAYQDRVAKQQLIDNSRMQLQRNLCE